MQPRVHQHAIGHVTEKIYEKYSNNKFEACMKETLMMPETYTNL